MTGASYHRGESKQDYATPTEFMAAVCLRFDIREFDHDLAADLSNSKALRFFSENVDSLAQDWRHLIGNLWLNPPYSNIAPWAQKCAVSFTAERRIFFLVPAAVGSNWHARYVDGLSRVFLLNGRISFDGKAPYPKDCMLCVYGMTPGYEVWRWR